MNLRPINYWLLLFKHRKSLRNILWSVKQREIKKKMYVSLKKIKDFVKT